jgi:hypothetical protein
VALGGESDEQPAAALDLGGGAGSARSAKQGGGGAQARTGHS